MQGGRVSIDNCVDILFMPLLELNHSRDLRDHYWSWVPQRDDSALVFVAGST